MCLNDTTTYAILLYKATQDVDTHHLVCLSKPPPLECSIEDTEVLATS